jgi:hypothetical protein
MNFAAHVAIFKGLLTRFQTLVLITTSEDSYKANFGELRYGEVRAEGRAGKAEKPVPRRWMKKGPVGREDGGSVPDRVMASIVHGRGPLVL